MDFEDEDPTGRTSQGLPEKKMAPTSTDVEQQISSYGMAAASGLDEGDQDGAVTADELDFSPPTFRRARAYRKRMHPEAIEGKVRSVELGKRFGVGLGLYFLLLNKLRTLLLMLALIAAPIFILLNVSTWTGPLAESLGYGNIDFGRDLSPPARLTLAALPEEQGGSGFDRTMVIRGSARIGKDLLLMLIALLDIIGTVIFFFTIRWCSAYVTRYRKRVDDAQLTVEDYSVLVWNVGPDASAEELLQHFTKIFSSNTNPEPVVELQTVSSSSVLLHLLAKMGALNVTIRRALAKHAATRRGVDVVHKAWKQMLRLKERADALIASDDSHFRVHGAFVVLNKPGNADAAISYYRQLNHPLLQCLVNRDWLAFKGRWKLLVERAGPPTDYIWENLVVGKWQRWLSSLLVNALLLLMLLVVLALATYFRGREKDVSVKFDFDNAAIAQNLTVESFGTGLTAASLSGNSGEAQAACSPQLQNCSTGLSSAAFNISLVYGQLASTTPQVIERASLRVTFEDLVDCQNGAKDASSDVCSFKGCLPCYCAGLSQATDLSWNHASAVREHCRLYLSNDIDYVDLSIRLGLTAVPVLANYLLTLAVPRLTDLERHYSFTNKERAIASRMFVCYMLNLAAIPILASMQWKWLSEWVQGLAFDDGYGDVTPGWYEVVATQISLNVLVDSILPQLVELLCFKMPNLSLLWSYCCGAVYTQELLNSMLLGPSFEMAHRLAQLSATVFLALLLGTGVPLLYWAAGLGCWLSAILGRYKLFRLCRQPSSFNEKLVKVVLHTLQLGILLHVAFAMWMLSYFEYAGEALTSAISRLTPGDLDAVDAVAVSPDAAPYGVVDRLTQPHCLLLGGVLALLVAWVLLADVLVSTVLSSLFAALCCCVGRAASCFMPASVEQAEGGPSFRDAVAEGLLSGPSTYDMHRVKAGRYFRLDQWPDLEERVRAVLGEAGLKEVEMKLKKPSDVPIMVFPAAADSARRDDTIKVAEDVGNQEPELEVQDLSAEGSDTEESPGRGGEEPNPVAVERREHRRKRRKEKRASQYVDEQAHFDLDSEQQAAASPDDAFSPDHPGPSRRSRGDYQPVPAAGPGAPAPPEKRPKGRERGSKVWNRESMRQPKLAPKADLLQYLTEKEAKERKRFGEGGAE